MMQSELTKAPVQLLRSAQEGVGGRALFSKLNTGLWGEVGTRLVYTTLWNVAHASPGFCIFLLRAEETPQNRTVS